MMTEAKLAPNLPDWMVEHANRYLSSGGTDGHMYKMTQPGRPEITVPALLLTTTGRKSGERQDRFQILGDDVADLHQIAEAQPARILGRRLSCQL